MNDMVDITALFAVVHITTAHKMVLILHSQLANFWLGLHMVSAAKIGERLYWSHYM